MKHTVNKVIFKNICITILLIFCIQMTACNQTANGIDNNENNFKSDFTLKTKRFELAFDQQGKPKFFTNISDKVNLLNQKDTGEGFYLKAVTGEVVHLDDLQYGHGKLVARSTDEITKQAIIIDNMSQKIKYSNHGTTWAGNPIYSNTPGSFAELEFEGNGIEVINSWQGNSGRVNVYLDGKLVVNELNTQCSPLQYKPIYSNKELPDGKHTIKVEVPQKEYVVLKEFKIFRSISTNENADKQKQLNKPEVVFDVNETDKYISFKINEIKNIPDMNNYTLHFQMNVDKKVKVMDLDYMTEINNRSNGVDVNWYYIWNKSPDNPKGAFAIYDTKSEDDEDDTILRIWANEGLPHPKIKGKWDLKAAKKWVEAWQKKFADTSMMILEGKNLKELYDGVKYAEKANIKQLYLFTNVWRSDPFLPNNFGNCQINKVIFPNGLKDLTEYSDYLQERGINLALHYTSGGIGLHDPEYIGKKPDRRLASWGKGSIEQNLEKFDDVIYFKPNAGVKPPEQIPQPLSWTEKAKPPRLYFWHGSDVMRVGDELVKIGTIEDTDKEVWKIQVIQRGVMGTLAADHEKGTDTAGLITAYNQNFLPDNDSTLLEEMAKKFADIINKGKIANASYDAQEIHTYNGQWGFEKYASLVYKNLEVPVTSLTSYGAAPKCHIEYRLNSSKRKVNIRYSDHNDGAAPIMLETKSRPSSSLLDAHFMLSQSAAYDKKRFNIVKPEPMFGLTAEMIEKHGLSNQILKAVSDWKKVNNLLTEKQKAVIRNSFSQNQGSIFFNAGSHPSSEYVYQLKDKQNQWEIVPTKVLTRESGDIKWQSGQEHGPVEPRQYIKPGDKIELNNPYEAQPAKFILHVMYGLDYDLKEGNYELLPINTNSIKDKGSTKLEIKDQTLTISAANKSGKDEVKVSGLPYWNRQTFMESNRGIGMWVTGDGSEAKLLLQVSGGDYVIPINFTGRKYIEIPSAQAAWSDGSWGWRFETKTTFYNQVDKIFLGFGELPMSTTAKVKVERIKALREIPTQLVNPVIHIGNGTLVVDGIVKTGQYLQYEGSDTAIVYDSNWNKLRELKVYRKNYVMKKGNSKVWVETKDTGLKPWLDVQIISEGSPIIVPKK